MRFTPFAVAALMAGVSIASAAPYTGIGPGTSTIGTRLGTEDYTTLAAAAAAIRSAPLTGGDWTFEITSDLNESGRIAIGTPTNGNSIILKPAASNPDTITITVTQPTDTGGNGIGTHIGIGSDNLGDPTATVSTDNFVLDGSKDGSGSRDLIITQTDNGFGLAPLSVIGDSDNAIIRNVDFRVNLTSIPLVTAIRVVSINEPTTADETPDNTLIENCRFTAVAANRYRAINIQRSGSAAPSAGADGTIIRNNEFVVTESAVLAVDYRNITIEGNLVEVQDNITGSRQGGFELAGANTTSTGPYTVSILNNDIRSVRGPFDDESARIYGMRITSDAVGVFTVGIEITNNIIGGIQLTGVDPHPRANYVAGIEVDASEADVSILNNSINIVAPASTYMLDGYDRAAGIGLSNVTANTVATVANNIVRVSGPSIAYAIDTDLGNITSDTNAFFTDNCAEFGFYNGQRVPNLVHWQEFVGTDANSIVADPTDDTDPLAGTWIDEGNLRFDGPALDVFVADPALAPATDIDGNVRSTTEPYLGAHEPAGGFYTPTKVTDWILDK